jgi:hypothetical protein
MLLGGWEVNALITFSSGLNSGSQFRELPLQNGVLWEGAETEPDWRSERFRLGGIEAERVRECGCVFAPDAGHVRNNAANDFDVSEPGIEERRHSDIRKYPLD